MNYTDENRIPHLITSVDHLDGCLQKKLLPILLILCRTRGRQKGESFHQQPPSSIVALQESALRAGVEASTCRNAQQHPSFGIDSPQKNNLKRDPLINKWKLNLLNYYIIT